MCVGRRPSTRTIQPSQAPCVAMHCWTPMQLSCDPPPRPHIREGAVEDNREGTRDKVSPHLPTLTYAKERLKGSLKGRESVVLSDEVDATLKCAHSTT